MNEFEENKYLEIKNELLESVINKKVDTYFVNRNELIHYYNVGKMIVDAQGGEARAKYGDGLIRKFSERLTRELGKGYSYRTLNMMRKFYIFQKVHPVGAQSIILLNWSHYRELLKFDDHYEILYYISQITTFHWSKRELQEHIKNKEFQRLDDKAKSKLINKEKFDIYDNIKNPIYINTYDTNINKTNIEEKVLKAFILRDMPNFLK